jgi:hypothetical protein
MSTQRPFFLRFAAVWILLCSGTFLLLAGFYWWLTWPDEHFWQVCVSFLWAALLVFAVACLLRTVLAAPAAESSWLPKPVALPCLATGLWFIVFIALQLVLVHVDDRVESVAVRFAQLLHLPPRMSISLLHGVVGAGMWLVAPALLLPLGSWMARNGFTALGRSGFLRSIRNLRYWAGFASALVLFYLSHRLIDWLPERRTLHGELVSAGWRLGLAYVLGVSAVVIAAWNTSRVQAGAEGERAIAPSVDS